MLDALIIGAIPLGECHDWVKVKTATWHGANREVLIACSFACLTMIAATTLAQTQMACDTGRCL
jgi:predicted alpha/beta hydrolase family esterase